MGLLSIAEDSRGELLPVGFGAREGGIAVMSNAELDDREREQQSTGEDDAHGAEEPLTALAGELRRLWESAYQLKQPHHRQMIRSLQQRKGQYDAAFLAELQAEGVAENFIRITDVKCRALESWIRDIVTSGGDRVFTLDPTAMPEVSMPAKEQMMRQVHEGVMAGQFDQARGKRLLSDAIKQINQQDKDEAIKKAEAMATLIEDQLGEGGFDEEFEAFITDISTFKTAFLKGPVNTYSKQLEWGEDFKPRVVKKVTPKWERISPFDMYPLAGSRTPQDGCFVRWELTASSLVAMKNVNGSNNEAIDYVLDMYGDKGFRDWLNTSDTERKDLEGRSDGYTDGNRNIDAIEFRGTMQGKKLLEWGVPEEKVPDPLDEYPIEAWLIGSKVIRCLPASDPLGRVPIYAASAITIPGSFWGQGIAEVMEDISNICQAAVRALVDNMSMASGPQIALDPSNLAGGEDIESMRPWKVWQVVQNDMGTGGLPVKFFQPEMKADELTRIYEKFKSFADEVTGIPAYAYGGDAGSGAARTASGLSMLMGAASKGVKQVIANISRGVIKPVVQQLYTYNMMYHEDDSVKGDLKVDVGGVLALIQKETTQMRRTEFLQTTNNPTDMQIMGIEGRAEVLRATANSLELDTDRVVPPRDELAEKVKMMQQAQQEQMAMEQQAGGGQPQQLEANIAA